jgi:hypothetical protein
MDSNTAAESGDSEDDSLIEQPVRSEEVQDGTIGKRET